MEGRRGGEPTPFDDTQPGTSARPDADASFKGRTVGDYIFGSVIGSGGMGVIYAAMDSKLQRKVAIKVIRAQGTSASKGYASGRLLREAQAMARLSHPNVVTIYQVGTIDDQVYVAMEFIDGQTLTQWLANAKPSWRHALDAMLQAGRGLQAAHAAGLIHRDFKPDNILIRSDGRALVTDFGLARAASGIETPPPGTLTVADVSLTQTGAIMGTPVYMAPEQHDGGSTDARSDQFSYCITLYEAVYGQRPFVGNSTEELAAAKRGGRIQPVPTTTRVPRWLRALLLRGLRADRNARFPELKDLLGAIDRRRSRQRGFVALGIGVAALAAISAVAVARPTKVDAFASCNAGGKRIVSIWNPMRTQAVRSAFLASRRPGAETSAKYVTAALDTYARQWATMHRDTCAATHARHEQSEALLDQRMSCLNRHAQEFQALIELFVAADGSVVSKAADAVNALSRIDDCAASEAMMVAAAEKLSPEARRDSERLSLELVKAKALASSSRTKAALAAAQQVVTEAKARRLSSVEAEALLLVARVQVEAGDYYAASDTLVRATGAADHASDVMLKASALVQLVYIEGPDLRRFAEAHVWSRLAKDAIERAQAPETLQARLLVHQGALHFAEGNYDAALSSLEKALVIQRRVLGPQHVDVATTLDLLGSTFVRRGKPTEALQHHRAAVAINTTLGEQNVHLAESLNNLGNALAAAEDLDGAAREYKRALEIWNLQAGPESSHTIIGHTNLGSLALIREDFDGALREFERALAIAESLMPSHPTIPETLTSIGATYLQRGSAADAIPHLERALKMYSEMRNPPIEEAQTRFMLARALWGAQRQRALGLAHTAQSRLATAGDGWRETLLEVEAWLSERER